MTNTREQKQINANKQVSLASSKPQTHELRVFKLYTQPTELHNIPVHFISYI